MQFLTKDSKPGHFPTSDELKSLIDAVFTKVQIKEVLLNLNRKRIFSPAEEKMRLEQKQLKECYVMAMALDIRLAIHQDTAVPSLIEKVGFRFRSNV